MILPMEITARPSDPFGELKIFAGKASRDLAVAICSQLGIGFVVITKLQGVQQSFIL